MIKQPTDNCSPPCRECFLQVEATWRKSHRAFLRRSRHYAHGDRDLAESFLSRATLKILHFAARSDRQIENVEALFYVSIKHIAADHWRKNARHNQQRQALEFEWPADTLHDTLDTLIAANDLLQVARASTLLTRPLRQLLDMHVVKGLSYREISASLNISEPLARKRMQLARRKLRSLTQNIAEAEKVTAKVHVSPSGASKPLNNTFPKQG